MITTIMSQQIKPMNSKELAAYFGVSYRTWMVWLSKIRDKIGPQVARTWNIKQIKIMIEHFGTPGE